MPGCAWTTASAVRAQCRQVAAGDLIAAVGLLDLAPLAGDESSSPQPGPTHARRGNARKRLPSLVEALTSRHQRQGDLAQSIEPELKEAHGGLRDMTVLLALAEAWLADRPHGGGGCRARAHLLDVRDAVRGHRARTGPAGPRGTTPSPPSSGTRTPTTS